MFKWPGAPWKDDHDLQFRMQTQLAMRRNNPSGGMALLYRDYKTRTPLDSELLAEAIEKLRLEFDQGHQFESEPIKPRSPDVTLGGQPCLCFEFAGVGPDSVRVSGYCHMLTYRGFAYWFFTWAPDNFDKAAKETNEKEADRVRRGFTLLDKREGWQEQKPKTFTVQAHKIRFRLEPVQERWRKEDRENYDPKADLVMLGTLPGEKPHAGRMATFQALVLDKAASLEEATKAAREYLLEAEKRTQADNTFQTKIDLVNDKSIQNIDDSIGDGATAGWSQKLRVEHIKDGEVVSARYVVLRILSHADGVLVLWCECDYQYLTFWDLEFTILLDSLSMK
jgi:hypothetical protein